MPDDQDIRQIKGYCGLCIARCGTIATVENGRFTRLDPDPSHPTGAALCAKGRAAPELVYSKDRLTRPLRGIARMPVSFKPSLLFNTGLRWTIEPFQVGGMGET